MTTPPQEPQPPRELHPMEMYDAPRESEPRAAIIGGPREIKPFEFLDDRRTRVDFRPRPEPVVVEVQAVVPKDAIPVVEVHFSETETTSESGGLDNQEPLPLEPTGPETAATPPQTPPPPPAPGAAVSSHPSSSPTGSNPTNS